MLYIPIIVLAIYMGVIALLIGNIIISVISFLLNSYYSADLIHYSTKNQILDVLPLGLISFFVSGLIWCFTFFEWNNWLTIISQVSTGIVLTVGIYEITKNPNYLEIRQMGKQFIGKTLEKTINN